MRKTALTAAVVALATMAPHLSAEDDFSALLADLTFADAAGKPPALEVASEEQSKDLQPVPTGLRQPVLLESSAVNLQGIPALRPAAPAPQVALQDPIPAPPAAQPLRVAQPLPDDVVGEIVPADTLPAPIPSRTVGHHGGVVHSPRVHPSHAHSGHGDCCHETSSFHPPVSCRQRTVPNLPSSTLLQYFRSDACYTNVWDGYHRSCKHHDHLHGTCNCFRNSTAFPCGEVIDCVPADCASCDGSCDR